MTWLENVYNEFKPFQMIATCTNYSPEACEDFYKMYGKVVEINGCKEFRTLHSLHLCSRGDELGWIDDEDDTQTLNNLLTNAEDFDFKKVCILFKSKETEKLVPGPWVTMDCDTQYEYDDATEDYDENDFKLTCCGCAIQNEEGNTITNPFKASAIKKEDIAKIFEDSSLNSNEYEFYGIGAVDILDNSIMEIKQLKEC